MVPRTTRSSPSFPWRWGWWILRVVVLQRGRRRSGCGAGILGLIATAVASSALLFFSILDFSKQESTAPSVLLHASDRADDDKCIPASGPWPGWISRKHSDVDDDNPYDPRNRPFQTCFSLRGGEDYCWSNSYYDSGDWKPCKPNGFGPQGWAFLLTRNNPGNIETCGTGCTKFA